MGVAASLHKPGSWRTWGLAASVVCTLTLLITSSRSAGGSEPRTQSNKYDSKTGEIPLARPAPPDLDLESPSAVHGWVEKKGHAAVKTWHSSQDKPRRESWDAFIKKRASGAIPLDTPYDGVPPHGPDPWGCRLYYNHPYKLFFVRTAKTGSTTILEKVLPSCSKRPELMHCLERVADSQMSVAEVSKLWKEYTAFTFTRNVWARSISQYQYLVHFIKNNGTESNGDKRSCTRITWDDFCRDPLLVGAVCRADARCCTKKWTHQDWHMRQQTSCFLTDGEPRGWAVDYIGRLEHFDADLLELFSVVNARREPGLPALKYSPQAPANSNPNACRDGPPEGASEGKGEGDDYEEDGEEDEGRRRLAKRRRRLAGVFDTIEGNQLSDVSYCDKRKFFLGQHEQCYKAVKKFFSTDVELLHPNIAV